MQKPLHAALAAKKMSGKKPGKKYIHETPSESQGQEDYNDEPTKNTSYNGTPSDYTDTDPTGNPLSLSDMVMAKRTKATRMAQGGMVDKHDTSDSRDPIGKYAKGGGTIADLPVDMEDTTRAEASDPEARGRRQERGTADMKFKYAQGGKVPAADPTTVLDGDDMDAEDATDPDFMGARDKRGYDDATMKYADGGVLRPSPATQQQAADSNHRHITAEESDQSGHYSIGGKVITDQGDAPDMFESGDRFKSRSTKMNGGRNAMHAPSPQSNAKDQDGRPKYDLGGEVQPGDASPLDSGSENSPPLMEDEDMTHPQRKQYAAPHDPTGEVNEGDSLSDAIMKRRKARGMSPQ
jgi:hypothetical protein